MNVSRAARPKREEESMAGPNYDKMSLKELLDLEPRLQKAIAAAKERERADIKHKISSMAETAGFSLSELFGAGRGGKGKTVAAKFANPDNRAETWTGRGRKPNWLVAKLGKGGKIDDFRI